MDEHIYIVTYDISDQKRWRSIFKVMNGFGEWLQFSVFQCRLTRKQHAELLATLDEIIHHQDDHVLMIDIGPAEKVRPKVISLGKSFTAIQREPIIV